MGVYQNKDLRVEGIINIRQLDQFYMKEQINEHMLFSLSGYITVEDAEEYERKELLGQNIWIYKITDKEKIIIGCGMVTEVEIHHRAEVYYVLVKGHSCSYKMSFERKSRSFQNPNWTYHQVVKLIANGKTEIFNYHKEETLKFPIIQYKETDWELLCRIAGQLQTSLISDVLSGKNRVFFGYEVQKVFYLNKESNLHYFHIKKDGKGKKKFCCSIKTEINMRLGDTAILNNRKWTVIEKRTEYSKGMLEIEYNLGSMEDWLLPVINNPSLKGAAIRGKILKRKNEYVKLWLDIDSSPKDSFWYPYLPETGNVMYAMPEEGSKAMLYFPDGREQNGIVTNSFLSNKSLNQKWNYFVKGIDIPACKEIMLRPGFIKITGNRKNKHNEILLGEDTGVQLVSNRPVQIVAKEGVEIHSGLSCSATAISKISVKQTGEKNSIEIFGNQIISKAEKYYTSSRIHKSRDSSFEKNNKQNYQSFNELYGSYIGMIARGDCGRINDKILGGIPVIGSMQGNIQIQNLAGVRIRRKS